MKGRGDPVGRARPWALACVALTPAVALCLFDPVHFTTFRPPKLAVAWAGLGLGLVAAVRARWRARCPGRPWEQLPWVLLLGWGALSLLWSPAPGRGLVQLAILALGWAMLVLAGEALGDCRGEQLSAGGRRLEGSRRAVLLAWLAAGVACGLVALYQRIWGWRLGVHQVTGTLGNPNLLATVLLLLVPSAHTLIRAGESRRTRLLGALGMCLLLAGIWATRCRAVKIALLAMVTYWLATSPWRPRRRLLAVFGLCALALCGALVWQGPLGEELAGRIWLARISLGAVEEHVWQGVGMGGYPSAAAWSQASLLARQTGPWSNLHDAHSQPLMILAELGLVGLVDAARALWPRAWLPGRRTPPRGSRCGGCLGRVGRHGAERDRAAVSGGGAAGLWLARPG